MRWLSFLKTIYGNLTPLRTCAYWDGLWACFALLMNYGESILFFFFTKWHVLTHDISEAKIRTVISPRNNCQKSMFSLLLLPAESQDTILEHPGRVSAWRLPFTTIEIN